MKQILLIFSAFVITCKVSGQWNDAFSAIPAQKDVAYGVYGNADYASTCISNVFAVNFLQGSYIGDNLKNQVSSQLAKFNRIGASLNYGAYCILYNDTVKRKNICNFFFALRHKSYLNTTFSPDIFNLGFYGNAMYAGKTTYLMPFSLNELSYQQAEAGFTCTNFGGKAELGIAISFLASHAMLAINERNGTLYTDPTGQYLQLNTDAQVYQSDTSANSSYINGYGASLDLYFKAPYKLGKRTGTIAVSATDLGFILWNKNSLYYHKDTSFYYDGITINNLSDLQNVGLNGLSKDSIMNKYLPFTRKSFYYTIPSTLSINSNTDYGRYHLELGFNYIYNFNAIAYIYAQGDEYLANGWMMALQIGYGGYSTLNAEWLLSRSCLHSTFSLSINHIPALIAPGYFGGAGIYLEYSHLLGK